MGGEVSYAADAFIFIIILSFVVSFILNNSFI